MFKITVNNKYSSTGLTYTEAIKDLPQHIIEGVYQEADERVCQDEPFASADFPLEGELMQQYEEVIERVLEESFNAIMERNNYKVKWVEL